MTEPKKTRLQQIEAEIKRIRKDQEQTRLRRKALDKREATLLQQRFNLTYNRGDTE